MTNDGVRVVRSTLDDVLAREEIQAALHRYARGVDRRDPDIMLSCYHSDAVDHHGGFLGTAAEFVHYVCVDHADLYRITMHFLAPPNIERRGDVADVDTYCIAHHLTHLDERGWGRNIAVGMRYVDRFERRGDGPWLIADRTVVYDWTHSIELDPEKTRKWAEDAAVGVHDRSDPWYALSGRA